MTTVFEKRELLTQPVKIGYPKKLSQTPPLTPVPSGSVLSAVVRQKNNIAYVFNGDTNSLNIGEDVPNFDPLPYVPQQYFNYADRYIGLKNIDQVHRMNEILRNEFNDKAIMAANPLKSTVYSAVNGLFDFPWILILVALCVTKILNYKLSLKCKSAV